MCKIATKRWSKTTLYVFDGIKGLTKHTPEAVNKQGKKR